MLLDCPRERPANAKLLPGHSSISRSRRSRANLLVFACGSCVSQSSAVRFLALTRALVLEHLTTCTDRSTAGQAQIQNATCRRRRAIESIKMHDHDFKGTSIDVTRVSLYLYYSQKSLTHVMPDASTPGIGNLFGSKENRD